MVMAALASYAITQTPQNPQRKLSVRKTRDAAPQRNGSAGRIDSLVVKAQPKLENEDSIPDSLLHPRWKIQRTLPITLDDLDQNAADLKRPDNLKQDVVYNDSLDRYIIGSKISDSYINAPFMMTQDEYRKWSERRMMNQFFRKKKTRSTRLRVRRSSTSPTCTSTSDRLRRYSVQAVCASRRREQPS